MTEARAWLLAQWSKHFAESLSGMTGESATVHPAESPAAPSGLIWAQGLQGFEGPVWWVAAPEEVWQAVGARVLELAGLGETSLEDRRNTFLEVLNQSLASLALDAGSRLGRELTLSGGTELAQLPDGLHWLAARLTLASGEELPPVALAFAENFTSEIVPEKVPPPAAAAAAGAASSAPDSGVSAPAGRTLDLLLEVELPVSVSFGRSQMRLRDLVKLNTGSIVELNRSVIEPVELIVNNCVIARGEVVVVEGNYGVRVKQIISRQERLRSLF